jgi:hypothetical protein
MGRKDSHDGTNVAEEKDMGPRAIDIRSLLIVLALLLLVPSALARSAAGTWTGTTSEATGLQVRPITLILDADGTGTMEVDVVLELEDVTIDGTMVAFSVRPLLGGTTPAQFRFRYEGTVEGDTMTLRVAIEGGGGRGGGGGALEPLVLTRKS